MFLGQFRHNLDSKDRLTVPSKYRPELEDGGYLMRGLDHNLMVLPPETFEIVSKKLNQMSLTNPTARRLRRMFFASAIKFDLDKSGRFLVPEYLRQAAGLKGEVVLNGAGDYFEIWAPDLWAGEESDSLESDEQRFAALDLATRD